MGLRGNTVGQIKASQSDMKGTQRGGSWDALAHRVRTEECVTAETLALAGEEFSV